MAKFAVFGSSYVTRLEKYCNADLKVPGKVRFFGKSGMRADSIPSQPLMDLINYKPDTVVIQLGGNDISATSSPDDIFHTLQRLQDDLHATGVKTVYFVEIPPRANFDKSPGLTLTSFQKQRNKINRLMMKKLNCLKLRGTYQDDYLHDRVHFNDSGLQTQFHAIRRPFFKC